MTRGVLAVISLVPLYQVNEGGGAPDTSHRKVVNCPIDTETVAGVTVGTAEGDKIQVTFVSQIHIVTSS